jgi:hypothetical protein
VERTEFMPRNIKRQKRISFNFLFFLIEILVLILIGNVFYYFYDSKIIKPRGFYATDHLHFANAPISPSNKLNDPNELHLIHAQKNGIKKPFVTTSEFYAKIDSLTRNSILVEVKENRFYQLKSLYQSVPYLIPEAVDLLNEIGSRFQKRLIEKKYKNFRFRITSLMRTEETQNKLSHYNHNATLHSAHLYGTTFDISYKNFYNTDNDSIEASYEAVQTLTKVLVEMRQECKFLAVREHHQSCFHITVVVCQPLIDKNYNHFWWKVK